MDPTNFPFDRQNCSIVVGSWQYDINRINLTAEIDTDYFEDATPNPIWFFSELNVLETYTYLRSPAFKDDDPENNFLNNDMNFNLIISRKPLYYMLNNIYPCFILNLVTLLTFFLPFASQLGISIIFF
jgi:nicotinic acetylcholine receptor, invertebrate